MAKSIASNVCCANFDVNDPDGSWIGPIVEDEQKRGLYCYGHRYARRTAN